MQGQAAHCGTDAEGGVTGEPGKIACNKNREGIGLKEGGQPAYFSKEAP